MCSMRVSILWHMVAYFKLFHHVALRRNDVMGGNRGIQSTNRTPFFPCYLFLELLIYNLIVFGWMVQRLGHGNDLLNLPVNSSLCMMYLKIN